MIPFDALLKPYKLALKMTFFMSILISPVSWFSFLTTYLALMDHSLNLSVAASDSEPWSLEGEAQALLASGWWSGYTDYTPSRCEWPGVACDANRSVTEISLPPQFQLGDKLAKFKFSSFPNLARLQLIGHGLVGNIPSEIGTLHKLTFLDLSLNEINGSIPSEIRSLKNLETLNLARNRLVGAIPSSLGGLTNLAYLYLNSNDISGSIPEEIGRLKNLIQLNLSNNSLVGSIPFTIGMLTNLKSLSLGWNQINGTIPLELKDLNKLDHLCLSNNHLSGPFPSFMRYLTNLVSLDLSGNKISGTISPELTWLTRLEYLNLSSNHLSGMLPRKIGTLSSLLILDLSWNGFRGVIPANLAACSKLQGLILQHNFLTGTIPAEIGYLFSLTLIDLSHNLLQGEIPCQLGNITNSRHLDLGHNQLSGTIPQSLMFLGSLDLSYNYLKGQIPNVLFAFPADAFVGNKDLCSDRAGFPSCLSSGPASNSIIKINMKVFLPVTISFGIFFLGYLLFKIWEYMKVHYWEKETKNGDLFSIWNYDGKIAFNDIIRATEDFDTKYCVGAGKFGSVYRAQLPTGRVVALKKLHSFEAKEPAFLKEFQERS